MIERIKTKLRSLMGTSVSDRRFLVTQSGGILFLQASYKVINFVIVWLLTHFLTKTIYGEYALVMSWVPVISVFTTLGLPRLLSREIARYHISHQWQQLRGYIQSALLHAIGIAIPIVPILWGAVSLILPDGSSIQNAFFAGIAMVVLYNLVRITQSILEGIKQIALSRLPDSLIQPLFFIVIVLALAYSGFHLNSSNSILLYAVTTLVFSILLGFLFIRIKIPPDVRNNSAMIPVGLVRQALPFMALNLFNVLDTRISTLNLGWLSGVDDVAVYSVITKGTDLLSFSLIAITPALIRIVLQRHLADDKAGMQRIVSRGTKTIFLVATPIALFFIFFGKWYLNLFGGDYIEGYVPLVVIVVGEMINVGSGFVGNFLSQLKHERIVSNVVFISLLLNIIIGLFIIPRYGILGAAISESIAMVVRNVTLAIMAKRLTGINTTVFS